MDRPSLISRWCPETKMYIPVFPDEPKESPDGDPESGRADPGAGDGDRGDGPSQPEPKKPKKGK